MSLKDMEPEGFDDAMRWYAHVTRPGRMYVQGFALRECGVWLSVDGVQTMIGFGDHDAALAEAEAWAAEQLAKVRQQIEDRKRCMPSNAKAVGPPLADGPA
jgi:hypothetical protein